MSTDKKPSYIDTKLAEFTDRFEAALEKERKERIAERKEYEAKREKERKEYEAKREKERKEYDAKREKERAEYRREVAVETGKLRDMWGQLAEFVIESGILETLNRHRDLSVNDALPNISVRCQGKDGKLEHGQLDIIVSGERDTIIVETKTTLTKGDVNYFLNKYLCDYARWQASSPYIHLPSYEGRRIFGCLAYMKAADGAEEVAVREGLITVHAFGDSSDLAHPDTVLVDYHPDHYKRS